MLPLLHITVINHQYVTDTFYYKITVPHVTIMYNHYRLLCIYIAPHVTIITNIHHYIYIYIYIYITNQLLLNQLKFFLQ